MTPADLAELLRLFEFNYWNERILQDAIGEALRRCEIDFSRELRLGPKSRIDFMVGSVGLEVKTASSRDLVLRQLKRYAEFEQVEGLVLVTNRLKHVFPSDLDGKPLEVVHLLKL